MGLSDHHCICHILWPSLLPSLSPMYPRGLKYSCSFNKSSSQYTWHSCSQQPPAHQGFLRTLQVPYQLWEWVTENIFTASPLCYRTDGLEDRWVIADWTAATLGSQDFKNKHILFELTGDVLHKLHLFCFYLWIHISQGQNWCSPSWSSLRRTERAAHTDTRLIFLVYGILELSFHSTTSFLLLDSS